MKKLGGLLTIGIFFFMFSCGSGPDTADDQDTPEEVEIIENEVEEKEKEVKERSSRQDPEVKERSMAGDKDQAAEKKPVERIRIEPEEKDEAELQLQKKEQPELQIERP